MRSLAHLIKSAGRQRKNIRRKKHACKICVTASSYAGGLHKAKRGSAPGLPDFYWYNIPKREKMYQITIKYTKWSQNIPKGRKIDLMAIKYTNILHC
jgi:protoporphyrinogen oxidase